MTTGIVRAWTKRGMGDGTRIITPKAKEDRAKEHDIHAIVYESMYFP